MPPRNLTSITGPLEVVLYAAIRNHISELTQLMTGEGPVA